MVRSPIFNSVLNAVECAISLQQALRKGPVIPVIIADRHSYRRGTGENKDIIGDAVNLASRIQSKGVAGSVLISEKINEELANHPEIKDRFFGCPFSQNVLQPVKLYTIAAKDWNCPAHNKCLLLKNLSKKSKEKESGYLVLFLFP